jgi:Tfp pilus assembly protein PilO
MDTIRLLLINLLSSSKKYFASTRQEQRDQIIGSSYAIFTVFAVAFFGFMALNPTISTISSLQKQLQDSQKLNKALEDKIVAITNLDQEYRQKEQAIALVLQAIPLSPEVPIFTRKMEKLASQTSVSLSRLSIGSIEIYPANKSTPSLYSFTVNFSVSGQDANITSFIDRMVAIDRVIAVDSISRERKTEGSNAAIVARVYFNR